MPREVIDSYNLSKRTFIPRMLETITEERNSVEIEDSFRQCDSYTLYKRRWLVLMTYCTLTVAVSTTSTSFPAISNILQEFYDVKAIFVHLLLAVFALMIILFNLPASYLLHKFELAFVLKLSALLNLAGGIIRYFSFYKSNGYYFLLIGNTFSALSLASFMFLPPKLALNWFGCKEKGRVNGIAVGFDMLSAALGFLHSTNVVKKTNNDFETATSIKMLVLHQLIMAVITTIIAFIFIKSYPPSPPSFEALKLFLKLEKESKETEEFKSLRHAQNLTDNEINFTSSLKKLCNHKSFMIILHIVTVSVSLEYSYSAILNDILIKIFPGMEQEIGFVGFTAIIFGFIANIGVGLILDKTKAYKRITQIIFILSITFLLIWTCFLEFHESFFAIAIAYCCLIMVATSYYSVANTHMVVVTYPISPGISSMVLMVGSSLYLIVIMLASSMLLEHISVLLVNVAAIILTALACVLSFFLTDENMNISNV